VRRHPLGAALIVLLAAGCATQGNQRPAWSVEPVVAVRHGMQEARAAYQLGRHHHARGRYDEAEAAYLRAVAAGPHDPDPLNALGVLYAERGETERAVKIFERALALEPLASRLHGNHGYALMLAGDLEGAAAALQRAVRLDRENRRAWRNLAAAWRRMGEMENAERADAAADGSSAEEIGTPAARPMPLMPVEQSPAGASDAPRAPRVLEARTTARLVRSGTRSWSFELRAPPRRAPAD